MKHKYLYIGNIIPNDDLDNRFHVEKATYLAQKGMIEAISKQTEDLYVLSYPQLPSFPKSKIVWLKGETMLINGVKYKRLSSLNLPLLRIIYRNIAYLCLIIKWCFKTNDSHTRLHIIQYNVSSPSLIVTLVGRLFRNTDVSAFLYDLGMPPSSYKLSKAKKIAYKLIDIQAKWLIRRLDYSFAINNHVIDAYSSPRKSIIIDGGISNDVLKRLPLPDNRDKSKFILLIAGNLTETNGIKMLLDASKQIHDKDIEFWFAGRGNMLDDIKMQAKIDNRIVYKGFLSTDELFYVYSCVNVLLNLRLMPENEGQNLFPSKLLEYLVTGREVITTNFAHVEKEYGEICYVLKENTLECLVDYIQQIKNNKKEIRGNKSQKYMMNTHTWDAQITQVINFINVERL